MQKIVKSRETLYKS